MVTAVPLVSASSCSVNAAPLQLPPGCGSCTDRGVQVGLQGATVTEAMQLPYWLLRLNSCRPAGDLEKRS